MLGGMGGGGGFLLRSAAATAAGIAGGALLFQGISSMFGHGYANSLNGGMGHDPPVSARPSLITITGTAGRAAPITGGGSDAGLCRRRLGCRAADYGGGGDFRLVAAITAAGGGDYGGGGDFGGGGDPSC